MTHSLTKLACFTLLALPLLAVVPSYGQAVIRPGDVFEMRLSGMPLELAQEFALQYTVSDDGSVNVPYIGPVRAGGASTTQFAHAVEQKFESGKIFTHPTVVINLQASSRFVTVGGGVRAPQAIPWSNDLSLSAAVNRAGGVGDFGKRNAVKITREGKSMVYNLKKADKDPSQNPKLLPGDEIEVKE